MKPENVSILTLYNIVNNYIKVARNGGVTDFWEKENANAAFNKILKQSKIVPYDWYRECKKYGLTESI